MKRTIITVCVLAIFCFSCSTQHVVTEHAIQKRKYRPGLFVSKKSKSVEPTAVWNTEDIAKVDSNTSPQTSSNEDSPLDRQEVVKEEQNKSQSSSPVASLISNKKETLKIPGEKLMRFSSKFIPAELAEKYSNKIGKYAIKQEAKKETNGSAWFGSLMGLLAIILLISGVVNAIEGVGFLLIPIAFIAAIIGLVFSIRGAVISRRGKNPGEGLSIFGIIANGIVLIIGLLALYVVLVWLTTY